MRLGVANLSNEQVIREASTVTDGVNATYNEPGRTYYGSVTMSF